MSTETLPPPRQVVLVQKNAMGDAAVHQLRKAGHTVVRVNDANGLKFYPETFNAASATAKIKAFEYALTQEDHYLSRSNLRMWYIQSLKEQKAF